jgi:PEP-CTERM motif
MKFPERSAGAAALGAAMVIGAGLPGPPAEAAFVMTFEQEGPNVVATGSGTIDLAGLLFSGRPGVISVITPSEAQIQIGASALGDDYLGIGATAPSNFGSGSQTSSPSSVRGDLVGADLPDFLVPVGYVSGDPLSDGAVFDNATLASLGITPGTYVWTWGFGEDADSFTLDIVAPPPALPGAPEPSTWAMMLIGFLGLAGVALRGRAKRTAAATAQSLGI